MLNVQKYLIETNSLEKLKEEFGIEYNVKDNLVILNYSQINSPKTNPIVLECRGTVLEIGSWDLVAKPFDRFFNLGEALELQKNFDWDSAVPQEKLDGSCIILFEYSNKWYANTRGAWGTENKLINESTWSDVVFGLIGGRINELSLYNNKLKELGHKVTYVFELCSPWNKIVRMYSKPNLVLLAMIQSNKDYYTELDKETVDCKAKEFNFDRPTKFNWTNKEDLHKKLEEITEKDKTFEGFVVVDRNNNRVKIKSASYLSLAGMGQNLFMYKNLIEWILKNEVDELLCYYPEAEKSVEQLTIDINKIKQLTIKSYNLSGKTLVTQKDFAIAITKTNPTPLAAMLFYIRKKTLDNEEIDWDKMWLKYKDIFLKNIKEM